MRRAWGFGAVVMLALLCAAPGAEAAFPGKNGKILFFRTTGPPQPSGNQEHYLINPDGTGLTDIGRGYGAGGEWAPDGSKYTVTEGFYGGTVRNASGNVLYDFPGNGHNEVNGATWSPDGERLAYWFWDYFCPDFCDYYRKAHATSNVDGSGEAIIYEQSSGSENDYWSGSPSWSPDGSKLAFVDGAYPSTASLTTINSDGTNPRELARFDGDENYSKPQWSPDGRKLALTLGWKQPNYIRIFNSDGSGSHVLETGIPGGNSSPTWSPDGSKIAFQADPPAPHQQGIYVVDAEGGTASLLVEDGYYPAWQPIPVNGFPRPKAATPTYVPLVPAFQACSTPNRVHAPPLDYGSCKPPAQASSTLTIGTFDSNGAAINSTGFVKLRVAPEGDVALTVSITDVRCKLPFIAACADTNAVQNPDYTGELRLSATVRATDKLNSPAPTPSGQGAGTVQDAGFGPPIPCTETLLQTGTGSTCEINTTVNALIPGLVVSGARSNWQFDQVRLYDGGTDGDGDTVADNTLFAVQGLFVP